MVLLDFYVDGKHDEVNIIFAGYAASVRGGATFAAANNASQASTFLSAGTFNNNPNPPAYSSGLMPPISEIAHKNGLEVDSLQKDAFSESHDNNDFVSPFPVDPWDDSAILSDNISGQKRFRDDAFNDAKPFSGLNAAEAKV